MAAIPQAQTEAEKEEERKRIGETLLQHLRDLEILDEIERLKGVPPDPVLRGVLARLKAWKCAKNYWETVAADETPEPIPGRDPLRSKVNCPKPAPHNFHRVARLGKWKTFTMISCHVREVMEHTITLTTPVVGGVTVEVTRFWAIYVDVHFKGEAEVMYRLVCDPPHGYVAPWPVTVVRHFDIFDSFRVAEGNSSISTFYPTDVCVPPSTDEGSAFEQAYSQLPVSNEDFPALSYAGDTEEPHDVSALESGMGELATRVILTREGPVEPGYGASKDIGSPGPVAGGPL
jgi:hypothetical protein